MPVSMCNSLQNVSAVSSSDNKEVTLSWNNNGINIEDNLKENYSMKAAIRTKVIV